MRSRTVTERLIHTDTGCRYYYRHLGKHRRAAYGTYDASRRRFLFRFDPGETSAFGNSVEILNQLFSLLLQIDDLKPAAKETTDD